MEPTHRTIEFILENQTYVLAFNQYDYGEGTTSEENIEVVGNPIESSALTHLLYFLLKCKSNNITEQAIYFGIMYYHHLKCGLTGTSAVLYDVNDQVSNIVLNQLSNLFFVGDVLYFRMGRLTNRLYKSPVNSIYSLYSMLLDNLSNTPTKHSTYILKFRNLEYLEV